MKRVDDNSAFEVHVGEIACNAQLDNSPNQRAPAPMTGAAFPSRCYP